MTPTRLTWLAALGLACLASSALLARPLQAPPRHLSALDDVYA